MFYKVIYKNIVIDILNNPTWVRWLSKSKRFLPSDIICANGVISSDGQYVYNLIKRGEFDGETEPHKSVELIEIEQSEYNYIKSQITEKTIAGNGNIISIEDIQSKKIEEMNRLCEQNIVNGFDIILSDGMSHHFTLGIYDQLKISKLNDRAKAGIKTLPYHADGEVCKYFCRADIEAINAKMEYLVEYHTTYFNSLKVYIRNIFNAESILKIQYGDKIPDEYCSVVLKDMNQSAKK